MTRQRWFGALPTRSATVGLVLALVTAAAASAGGRIFFADLFATSFNDGYIRTVASDGYDLHTLLNIGGGLRGIALDNQHGWLYWTDVNSLKISRATQSGTNVQDVVTTGLAWPMAVAVAPAADWLFWGDQTNEEIGRAHLDGSGAAPLLSTPFHAGLAVDPNAAQIYWSTSDSSEAGRILRANFDGSNVQIIVANQGKPARLTLDVGRGKIYWTDYVLDVVRRANLDGSNVETLFTAGANHNPNGITLDITGIIDGRLLWGQDVSESPYVGKIMEMSLSGANPRDRVTGLGSVTDMAYHPFTLGDMNCDGRVDFGDINPYVLALTDPAGYHAQQGFCDTLNGDINGDGYLNFDDINPFVYLLQQE